MPVDPIAQSTPKRLAIRIAGSTAKLAHGVENAADPRFVEDLQLVDQASETFGVSASQLNLMIGRSNDHRDPFIVRNCTDHALVVAAPIWAGGMASDVAPSIDELVRDLERDLRLGGHQPV